MNSSFNDSSWTSAPGAFGTAGTPGISPNTTWNTGDIWLRRTFVMPTGSYSGLQFLLYHDEDIQVYLNGVLAYSATGYITSYQTASISAAALAVLTPGATIELAVHCHQTAGGQGVDVGLVNIEQYVPIVPTSQATPQTWKYIVTTTAMSGGWMNSGYNDSSWTSGLGSFGTVGITPGIFPNTTWTATPSYIYLRRTFTMPSGTYSGLEFVLYHDEDISVYLNGILAYTATGFTTSYQTATINSAALAVLTPGATITLAVTCHQTTGGQGVDVGLVNVVQYTQNAPIVPSSQASTQSWQFANTTLIGPRINSALGVSPLVRASAAAVIFASAPANSFPMSNDKSSNLKFPLYRDEDV